MSRNCATCRALCLQTHASPAGPGWPEFDPLSRQQLNSLLLGHALHVVPSEREGFGHAINEGRAAGALLLVPRHPPMSELVRQGAGVLIAPAATFSHADAPVPALARYGNISASVSPEVRARWAMQLVGDPCISICKVQPPGRRAQLAGRLAVVKVAVRPPASPAFGLSAPQSCCVLLTDLLLLDGCAARRCCCCRASAPRWRARWR